MFEGAPLTWSADVSGTLGTGTLLTVWGLPVGIHHVTLAATDSDGLTNSTTFAVEVVNTPSATVPLLYVEPARLQFVVDKDVTEPFTRTLAIYSVGTDELAWTAATGAPYIHLNAANGTTPAEIEVRLDPGALPAAENSTLITVSSGNLVQLIPVSLDKLEVTGPQVPAVPLWLPHVFR
jgi:hypothetical protein